MPQLVLEVLAGKITSSPIHSAGKAGAELGHALRFPRLISFRESSKRPEDVITIQELIELYKSQGKKYKRIQKLLCLLSPSKPSILTTGFS